MKKVFLMIVTAFMFTIAFTSIAFASTAVLYNTDGNLCNLYGRRVYSTNEAAISGTVYENGGRRFFHNNNGTDPTNVWIDIDGRGDWHYAGSDCYFVKDAWVKFGSKSYYLDTNGNWVNTTPTPVGPGSTPTPVASTGWRQMSNNKWRYYYNNSSYYTGWQWLNWSKGTNWFYFDGNGYMYANTWTPDGYWVDSNGAWDGCYYCDHSSSTQAYCTHCGKTWTSSSGHYCSKCGGDNREAGIYCKHCGNTSDRTHCYACGKQTGDKNAKYCSKCGENLTKIAVEDRTYCGKCGKKLPH